MGMDGDGCEFLEGGGGGGFYEGELRIGGLYFTLFYFDVEARLGLLLFVWGWISLGGGGGIVFSRGWLGGNDIPFYPCFFFFPEENWCDVIGWLWCF